LEVEVAVEDSALEVEVVEVSASEVEVVEVSASEVEVEVVQRWRPSARRWRCRT